MGAQEWRAAALQTEEAIAKVSLKTAGSEQLRGVEQLDQFLKSDDGKAGLDLLAARKSWIRLAESEPCFGYCTVWFLDGEGLKSSNEANGMWIAYAKRESVREPSISPATAADVFSAVASYGEKELQSPGALVAYISARLDQLASQRS